jgi:hypothetical protein
LKPAGESFATTTALVGSGAESQIEKAGLLPEVSGPFPKSQELGGAGAARFQSRGSPRGPYAWPQSRLYEYGGAPTKVLASMFAVTGSPVSPGTDNSFGNQGPVNCIEVHSPVVGSQLPTAGGTDAAGEAPVAVPTGPVAEERRRNPAIKGTQSRGGQPPLPGMTARRTPR